MAQRNDYSRADRIRKALMKEVSDIVARDIKDPALDNILISITDVEVTQDLRFARIYFSVMAEPDKQQEVIELLKEHQPQIRSAIGHRIRLRYTPEIDIRLDDSLERGARVSQILDQISRGEV